MNGGSEGEYFGHGSKMNLFWLVESRVDSHFGKHFNFDMIAFSRIVLREKGWSNDVML